MSFRRPKALRPGDRVAVVAPAGPVREERLQKGLAVLAQRYEVVTAPGLLSRTGFLAGPDGRRLAELRWALSDPTVRAVFCGRGGHGLLRLVPALSAVAPAEQRAVPIIGFSDVTVLLAWAAQARLIAVHGPVVTQLGALPEEAAALFALLEAPACPPPLRGLEVLSPGRAVGRLLGGNLEVLSRLCGTPLGHALRLPEPVILLLEEVGEQPYRMDRALTQLLIAGLFDRVAGVVIGDLIGCEAKDEGPGPMDVIRERLLPLGVPVLGGAPIGHGARNRPVPLGVLTEIDAAAREVRFLEPPVL